jgi:hypothetical protein
LGSKLKAKVKASIGKAKLNRKAKPKGKANVQGKADGQGQAQPQLLVSASVVGSSGCKVGVASSQASPWP